MSFTDNLILQWLDCAAASVPDKPAYTEGGKPVLTYSGLRARTASVANALVHALGGVSSDDAPVAVMVSRNAASVSDMLAVVAAGMWYVPIDAELPVARISALLGICRPAAVIRGSECRLPDDLTAQISVPVIVSDNASPAPDFDFIPRDSALPLFGIFTSGSTGTPKLVVKSLRAMTSFIGVYCRTFGFSQNEVFGNQIPFYFDASTKDIYASLMLGATVEIIPAQAFSFPVNLISIMNTARVTTIVWVPSALSVAAKFNVFSASVPEYLNNVLFVGELMPVKYLNIWRRALPSARFVNLYGSTEVAGNSCYYIVDRDFAPTDILPIGYAFDGTRVFLLKENDDVPSPDSEGEICIAGDGLADGYYHDPERTAGVFRTVSLPGFSGRIYRSGDYGRVNERGELVCISRRDSQIKHMGHRIELGEIEAAASSLSYVSGVCCIYSPVEEKIILFAAADDSHRKSLRTDLSGLLPRYMLPHKFILLPELPRNRNGKTDRARLKNEYLSTVKPQ